MTNDSQLSLILPQQMYTAVRQAAEQRGLSIAAYVRLLLATGQRGGDVSGLFSLPADDNRRENTSTSPAAV